MTSSLDKAAQEVGELVLAHSTNCSERIELLVAARMPQPGWQIDESKFKQLVTEFTALFLYVSDRLAFDLVGPKRRLKFGNGTLAVVNAIGTSLSLSKPHPAPPFVSNVQAKITIVGVNTDLLNSRGAEYARFTNFLKSDRFNHPNTLTWAFGVHVSDVFAEAALDPEIQGWSRMIAIESYAMFLPSVRRLLEEATSD
jgi:hypothetical protein